MLNITTRELNQIDRRSNLSFPNQCLIDQWLISVYRGVTSGGGAVAVAFVNLHWNHGIFHCQTTPMSIPLFHLSPTLLSKASPAIIHICDLEWMGFKFSSHNLYKYLVIIIIFVSAWLGYYMKTYLIHLMHVSACVEEMWFILWFCLWKCINTKIDTCFLYTRTYFTKLYYIIYIVTLQNETFIFLTVWIFSKILSLHRNIDMMQVLFIFLMFDWFKS